MENINAIAFENANPGVSVNDCGAAYIKVSAPSKFEAFSAAIDYVAKNYADHSFAVEGPFGVGMLNGAYLNGYGYILKAA